MSIDKIKEYIVYKGVTHVIFDFESEIINQTEIGLLNYFVLKSCFDNIHWNILNQLKLLYRNKFEKFPI